MSNVARPSIDAILQVHRDGIAAIADITRRYDAHQWQLPTPCDEWTAVDLAGHVITAATMWHEALDDATTGIETPRWRWADMPRHNTEYLAALPEASGPDRINEFVDLASRWCDRVADTDPELPMPVAVQEVCPTRLTVGLFAWLAGIEFHLHAWDLAQTIGEDYRSSDAQAIFEARAALFGNADDGRFGTTIDGGDPWDQIIQRSRS